MKGPGSVYAILHAKSIGYGSHISPYKSQSYQPSLIRRSIMPQPHYNPKYRPRSEQDYGQSSGSRWVNDEYQSRGESSSSRNYHQSYRGDYDNNRDPVDRRNHAYSGYSDNNGANLFDGGYASHRGYTRNNGNYEQYDRRTDYPVNRYEDNYSARDYPVEYMADNHRQTYIPPHQRRSYNPSSPQPAFLPPFPPTVPLGLPQRPPSPSSWSNPTSQTRHYNTRSSRSPMPRDRTVTPPPVTLPPQEYLKLSQPQPMHPLKSDKVIPKLLVLDLNGALVFRNRGSSGKISYPRPYLTSFLDYLFLPLPLDRCHENRGWEVFVWSSAQPHNVRGMVENAFGPRYIEGIWEEETQRGKAAREGGEGRSLGVWARDKMGLNSSDYTKKIQTTKDLRKVIDHLRYPEYGSAQRPMDFDERSIVLLDDSPLKAIYQPFNQVVIPEYGKNEYQSSKHIASLIQSGINADREADGIDQTLLAVIGILEELRFINNVPAWIRSGGLSNPDLNSNSSDEILIPEEMELELEDLPSHEGFKHWFKDEQIFNKWVEKGKQALRDRDIEIRHGITPDRNTSSRPSNPSSPSRRRGHSPVKLFSKRGYHTNNRIDDDEISLPDIQIQHDSIELRPIDIVNYLEGLISGTSNLTIGQKNSLLIAKEILSDLHDDDHDFPSVSISRQNGNADQQRKGKGKGQTSKAFQAAKKLNPDLSRRQFRKQRQAESNAASLANSTTSSIVDDRSMSDNQAEDQSLVAQEQYNDDDEVEIVEISDGDDESDIQEITEDDYRKNSNGNLTGERGREDSSSSRSQGGGRELRKSIGQLSDLLNGSAERERDEGSKKLRSDSWSGLD